MHNSKFIIHNSRILGIDPGYGRLGLAIIEKRRNGDHLIYSECFETSAKLPHSKRLSDLGERLDQIIKKYQPNQLAIETLLWSKNTKTALQVAEARGVILFQASKNNLIIREFNPNQIKLAVTGYGKSDKKQIISMVKKLIQIDSQKKYDDEYDAIAIALTASAIKLSPEND